MKLQILVPRHNEPINVMKPLFDSIAIQQNVDFSEIGVIVVNDGLMTEDEIREFSDAFNYEYDFIFTDCESRGVSATRNMCLDLATADYVMFCDCDDMFFNVCGLYLVLNEINNGGFDSLTSSFIEETRNPETKEPVYVPHQIDSTFVHGKVHRRQYLIDQKIRWNPALTIHEDSFFNILCQRLSDNVKYCPNPFYLWKWRDDSVCRHDPKYILKTYNNLLDSATALVEEFLSRDRKNDAKQHITSIIFDAYYTLNKKEWIDQENQEYRNNVEKRFKVFYETYEDYFNDMSEIERAQIIVGIKNRMFTEGLFMESITFDDWIKHIKSF